MKILDEKYLNEYLKKVGKNLDNSVKAIKFNGKDLDLGYNTQVSAVFSSNIEGNSIDLNSYINLKLFPDKIKKNHEIEEIDNLILAYQLAQKSELNEKSFFECHKLLSKTLVSKNNQGKYRKEKIGVFDQGGLVYLAVEPEFVQELMKVFFNDINELLKNNITVEEVLYFASMIHLKFVHIHPFRDGNGRAARLLEKWFLVEKLNKEFWNITSEKYYLEHRDMYYKNINLGVNYYELNYKKCIPFLLMLPNALMKKK